uniref:hypothetical protein n=1 Tax=unclassified Streptomyces TaxID=2593676 RepID=UPI003F49299A
MVEEGAGWAVVPAVPEELAEDLVALAVTLTAAGPSPKSGLLPYVDRRTEFAPGGGSGPSAATGVEADTGWAVVPAAPEELAEDLVALAVTLTAAGPSPRTGLLPYVDRRHTNARGGGR